MREKEWVLNYIDFYLCVCYILNSSSAMGRRSNEGIVLTFISYNLVKRTGDSRSTGSSDYSELPVFYGNIFNPPTLPSP